MNKRQNNIISHVLLQVADESKQITEERIETLVRLFAQFSDSTDSSKTTEEEIAEIISHLHTKISIKIDRGHFIQEESHTPWYFASKGNYNSNFWERYRRYLLKEKHWNSSVVNELDRTTDDIMDLLGNPELDISFHRKGLCIGDVQSGKTSTYIGLINKAADVKYRVIILLTGTIEKLRRQTQQRVDDGFIGLDSLKMTQKKGSVFVGVGKYDKGVSGWAMTSTGSDFNTATASKLTGKLSSITDPVIFVLKKNKTVLDRLETWLRTMNTQDEEQIDLPMLLIDDEADYASVNTKVDDVTAINNGIRKILGLFKKSNYVGFTATPYANVFIDPDTDDEMQNSDLFPRDFIYALESPSNYIGARSVFSHDGTYNYMLKRNDDCESYLPLKHKKNDRLQGLPISLKYAIASFLLINTIQDLRGSKKNHRTMMINISRFIAVQNDIAVQVDDYLRDIKIQVHNYSSLEEEALKYSHIRFLKEVFDRFFVRLPSHALFPGFKHFKWEKIQASLYKSIAGIQVRSVNGGNAPKNLDYDENKENGLRLIAVGGLSLSRGLTLEGLSVSYFYRNSTMYDTLMQMGRWFGYRDEYKDLCQIWMPEISMGWYEYISMATDELRAQVARMQAENKTPIDFGLAVRSDIKGLLVTALNKMRSTYNYETVINFSGEVIETRFLHKSTEILRDNFRITDKFIRKLQREYTDGSKTGKDLALDNLQFLGVRNDDIIAFLKQFKAHTKNYNFHTSELIDMFTENKGKTFDKWDIVIAHGQGELHFISDDKNGRVVKRNFAIVGKGGAEALQMSAEKSRLGSANMAKGGLTKEEAKKIEKRAIKGNPNPNRKTKTISENLYFKSGLKRNPLLLIYPIQLKPKQRSEEQSSLEVKENEFVQTIDFPVIGLSIGIPEIDGQEKQMRKYKFNKIKYRELIDIDEDEDFEEIDETIMED